jgi:hypothetical protein
MSYGVVATRERVTFPDGRYTSLQGTVWGLSVFGSRVVWTNGRDGVSWRDATSAAPTTEVAAGGTVDACYQADHCPRGTSLWGDRFAVRTNDGSIVVWDLTHRTSRTVSGPSACTDITWCLGSFVLDHDVLVYVDSTTREVRTLDLTSPSSQPVTVGAAPTDGSTPSDVTAADGRAAWVEGTAIRWTTIQAAAVEPAERLLYALPSGPGLSPNGDGRADAWSIDTHNGSAGATLTLTVKLGSAVVRTLSSTARGDVRLTWDGRGSDGKPAVDGTYTWSLTGVDANGRPMVANGGASSISGHVVVRSSAPPVIATGPELSTSVTAVPGRTTASWKPAIAVPSAANGYTLQYERQIRELTTDSHGHNVYGPWKQVTDAAGQTLTSATSGVDDHGWSTKQGPVTLQWSVRGVDSIGNTGPWSAATSTAVVQDDTWRGMTWYGAWTPAAASPAYRHAYRQSTVASASVQAKGSARKINVVGTLCSTCGKVQISVNGAHYHRTVVVDSYSKTTQYRHAWLFTVPHGTYDVVVTNVGSGSRKRTRVDGIGFLL